ncbi:MAG: 3'(2'),5'-bisphosphate nucleotidase CysQ [Alistipes sp.]|nr:3'(2'),5'-bisphosphate nucleotidase CysQ [Candidatus Alistipes equi]
MIEESIETTLLSGAVKAAVKAGFHIMNIYTQEKPNEQTLEKTNAIAQKTIKEALGFSRIPILSEEGREMLYDERRNWELFWLVDPLDGSMEFLKQNNEFTVNIALMEENVCICSVVYVPFLNKIYFARHGKGAFLVENVKPEIEPALSFDTLIQSAVRLPKQISGHDYITVAVSRSHFNDDTKPFIESIKEKYHNIRVIEQGSSYKFCMLAEGKIDYYPRTSFTFEWDTAATELILKEAGGDTRIAGTTKHLTYNKEDLRNPWFECFGPYFEND